jgi:plastocyanin
MKKLLVVLMILFVGILLAGCASTPTAPVTPTQAMTPVSTTQIPATVATVMPTTVAINATPTATPTPTPIPQPVVTITLTNYNTVNPTGPISVTQGTKVVWVNQNQAYLNQIVVQGLFTSGSLKYNQQFSYTFTKTGIYVWYSTGTNGIIKGTITVK